MKFTELQSKIREAASRTSNASDLTLVDKVMAAAEKFLTENNFCSQSKVAMERFDGNWLIDNVAAVESVDPSEFMVLAKACDITNERLVLSVATEAARVLSGDTSNVGEFVNPTRTGGLTPLNQIVGPSAATSLKADSRSAMEAFGVDMNAVASDARAALFVAIMRGHKSLIDRILPRVSKDSSVVTVKIDNPRIYDLAKSADKSADVRNGSDHEKPLIHLFTDPEMADTSAKRVVPRKANDTGAESKLLEDGVVRSGVVANLLDLSATAAVVGVDYTDLLSEGGVVESLVLKVTRTAGDGSKTSETFKVDTAFLSSARYVVTTNNDESTDRVALLETFTTLAKGAKTTSGADSVLLADYLDHTLRLVVGYTSKVTLRGGDIQGAGSVRATVTNNAGGDPVADMVNDFKELSFEVIGFVPFLKHSEENLRRTTAAVRLLTFEKSFEIPVARSHVVEFSLQQETPQQVIDTVSTVISHGNSYRALNLIEDIVRDVAARNSYEDKNPGIPDKYKVNRDFMAGTQCNPRVYLGNIDVSDTHVKVMRETERLSDLHNYVTEHLVAITADLHDKSLLTVQMNEGEEVVYKIVTSGPIKDVLFGVRNYYNHLDDKVEGGAAKADYSLRLSNGVRLDIHATSYKFYTNKILMIPIRENNETELTSFGQNLDRGTWAGNYTATSNGAAVKRAVVNAREMPWVTNPVAVLLNVENLDEQLSSLNKA